jgi:membrane protease YdiL (CAAX protease family)
MSDWATFALATVALTLLLLLLTRRSQRLLERARIVDADGRPIARSSADLSLGDPSPFERDGAESVDSDVDNAAVDSTDPDAMDDPVATGPTLATRSLLLNAGASQAVALALLAGIAWWTAVPMTAFGVGGTHPTVGTPLLASLGGAERVALGAVAGVALAAGNEGAARLGARVGLAPSDRLRSAMAPETPGEWALLLGVVLPVVAVFEEALFRGALVGAFAVGLPVDPALLVVASSLAFGLGHGAQGRLGIAVTGVLGLGLAGLFVATGSLLVPIVAHYVVNAAEFVVHEGA